MPGDDHGTPFLSARPILPMAARASGSAVYATPRRTSILSSSASTRSAATLSASAAEMLPAAPGCCSRPVTTAGQWTAGHPGRHVGAGQPPRSPTGDRCGPWTKITARTSRTASARLCGSSRSPSTISVPGSIVRASPALRASPTGVRPRTFTQGGTRPHSPDAPTDVRRGPLIYSGRAVPVADCRGGGGRCLIPAASNSTTSAMRAARRSGRRVVPSIQRR
jgi:hypothetical protein